MALVIPATSSTDSYVQWGGNQAFVGGVLNVANASVYVILQHALRGQLQISTSDDPVLITPGTGAGATLYGTPDDLIVGFQIKSAVSGTPAVYSGSLYPPNKAGIGAGAAFTGTVSTSGGFTPPATSSGVTGIIPAAGTTPTAGTGFTYTHTNGTGVYVFTFTTAFAAAPTVLVTPTAQGGGNVVLGYVTSVSTTGFTANIVTRGTGAAQDAAFNFLAETTV